MWTRIRLWLVMLLLSKEEARWFTLAVGRTAYNWRTLPKLPLDSELVAKVFMRYVRGKEY